MDIMTKKIEIVCSTCGSEDVRRDAMAAWDFDKQDWMLVAVMDQGYCEGKCAGECSLSEVEIPLWIKLMYKPDELLKLDARHILEVYSTTLVNGDVGSRIVMDDGTEHKSFYTASLVKECIKDAEKQETKDRETSVVV